MPTFVSVVTSFSLSTDSNTARVTRWTVSLDTQPGPGLGSSTGMTAGTPAAPRTPGIFQAGLRTHFGPDL